MRTGTFVIGVDLGTDAARAVVADASHGGLAVDPAGATPVLTAALRRRSAGLSRK
ncbi:hypothetical protein AB3662_22140 [Sorangium cellulosum]|uniref:hypothetical protein n=1 Tax=Sorangium cellulosum TaxID=56 RepID=UPI003D9A95DC